MEKSDRHILNALTIIGLGLIFVVASREAGRYEPIYKQPIAVVGLASILILWLATQRILSTRARTYQNLTKESDRWRLARETQQLETEILHALNAVSESFMENTDLDAVLNHILGSIQKILDVDVAILQLETEGKLEPMHIWGQEEEITLDQGAYEKVIRNASSILINNLSPYHSLYEKYLRLYEQGFRSLLFAPLRVKGRLRGLLGALTRATHDFTGEELRLLTTYCNHAALIIENAQLLETTRRLSITDELTSLYNYRHFKAQLENEFYRAKRYNRPLSLIMGDIDDFKHFNDTNGHSAGNVALAAIGKTLSENTRPSDISARYGGEEFALLLIETPKEDAAKFAESLRRKIEETPVPREENQPGGVLTLSLGVSGYPEDGNTTQELVKAADQALYQAKGTGKNQVYVSGKEN